MLQMSCNNIIQFELEWRAGGIKATGNRSHQVYLEKMCKQLQDILQHHLNEDLLAIKNQDNKMKLFEEISHHVSFCQQR
jgi:hypothetical protein